MSECELELSDPLTGVDAYIAFAIYKLSGDAALTPQPVLQTYGCVMAHGMNGQQLAFGLRECCVTTQIVIVKHYVQLG